jgi:hypothetical protein
MIAAVRFDVVPGLLGNQKRRHTPAVIVLLRQKVIPPVATRTSTIDKDEVCGLDGLGRMGCSTAH